MNNNFSLKNQFLCITFFVILPTFLLSCTQPNANGNDSRSVDFNGDGIVTLEEVKKYVNQEMFDGEKDIEDIRSLLESDNIDAQDSNKFTALHHAAYRGHTEIVKALILAGANLELKTNAGGNYAAYTPLIYAAQYNHIEAVNALLDAGANPNVKDSYGDPILSHALGNTEILKILMAVVDNIDEKGCFGYTALHYAAMFGEKEALLLLFNAGANIENLADYSSRPIHDAVQSNRYDVVQELLRVGAEVDVKDDNGDTPLIIVTWGHFENVEMLQLLLDNNATVDAQNERKYSPLIYSAEKGYARLVELLLDKNADKTLKTTDGKTALDIATEKNQDGNRDDIIALLTP